MQSLLTRLLLGGGGGFSPAALFSSGAEGVWYDPSDTSTLFQDTAGTTPVTAVEQPVGLMLDKSKGLVPGPELVTNGAFSTDSNWVKETGWVITGGAAVATSTSASIYQNGIVTSSKTYQIEIVVATVTAGSVRVRISSLQLGQTITTPGTYTMRLTATGTGSVDIVGTGFTGSIDNISVRELPGNHAISYNSTTARPTLSARVNLLVNTGFIGAVAGTPGTAPTSWSFVLSTGAISNVDAGRLTFTASATRIVLGQSLTYAVNTTYRSTFVLHENSGVNAVQLFTWNQAIAGATETFFANGVSQNQSTYIPAAGDVLSYQLTIGATAGSSTIRLGLGCAATATGQVTVSQPDIRPLNQATGTIPLYQQVNTSTDYDTDGFPKYLSFDGSDDGMSTPANLNLTSTDKVTVFSGVRKLIAGTQQLVEFSSTVPANNGAFSMPSDSGTGTWGTASKGTSASIFLAESATNSYVAPVTTANTGLHDLSLAAGIARLRVNGSQVAATSAGTAGGNFGTYPLYIGSRANNNLWFNGYLYGLTVVGAQLTTPQIESMESWTAQRTGITL